MSRLVFLLFIFYLLDEHKHWGIVLSILRPKLLIYTPRETMSILAHSTREPSIIPSYSGNLNDQFSSLWLPHTNTLEQLQCTVFEHISLLQIFQMYSVQ